MGMCIIDHDTIGLMEHTCGRNPGLSYLEAGVLV